MKRGFTIFVTLVCLAAGSSDGASAKSKRKRAKSRPNSVTVESPLDMSSDRLTANSPWADTWIRPTPPPLSIEGATVEFEFAYGPGVAKKRGRVVIHADGKRLDILKLKAKPQSVHRATVKIPKDLFADGEARLTLKYDPRGGAAGCGASDGRDLQVLATSRVRTVVQPCLPSEGLRCWQRSALDSRSAVQGGERESLQLVVPENPTTAELDAAVRLASGLTAASGAEAPAIEVVEGLAAARPSRASRIAIGLVSRLPLARATLAGAEGVPKTLDSGEGWISMLPFSALYGSEAAGGSRSFWLLVTAGDRSGLRAAVDAALLPEESWVQMSHVVPMPPAAPIEPPNPWQRPRTLFRALGAVDITHRGAGSRRVVLRLPAPPPPGLMAGDVLVLHTEAANSVAGTSVVEISIDGHRLAELPSEFGKHARGFRHFRVTDEIAETLRAHRVTFGLAMEFSHRIEGIEHTCDDRSLRAWTTVYADSYWVRRPTRPGDGPRAYSRSLGRSSQPALLVLPPDADTDSRMAAVELASLVGRSGVAPGALPVLKRATSKPVGEAGHQPLVLFGTATSNPWVQAAIDQAREAGTNWPERAASKAVWTQNPWQADLPLVWIPGDGASQRRRVNELENGAWPAQPDKPLPNSAKSDEEGDEESETASTSAGIPVLQGLGDNAVYIVVVTALMIGVWFTSRRRRTRPRAARRPRAADGPTEATRADLELPSDRVARIHESIDPTADEIEWTDCDDRPAPPPDFHG